MYIARSLCISSYKRKGSLDIEMHILICPGEGFLLCESRGQPRKGSDTWLAKAPPLFPKGWAGQAVPEQRECQVSESVSFGADRWKDNWWITEITSPSHFLFRAGPWRFPPKFWNASRMVIPIPQWLRNGVYSHSGPFLEKSFPIPNPNFWSCSGINVVILSLFVGTWTSPAPPSSLL